MAKRSGSCARYERSGRRVEEVINRGGTPRKGDERVTDGGSRLARGGDPWRRSGTDEHVRGRTLRIGD